MKKVIKIVLSILLILILLASLFFTYFVGKSVFEGFSNSSPREETIKNISIYKDMYKDFDKKRNVEKVTIQSSKFDHEIPGIFLSNKENKDVAILIHGMGGTKETLLHMADIFMDLGFNCLIYDQRNSGENLTPYNSFGVLESYDANDVLSFVKENFPSDAKILMFGESAGAATALISRAKSSEDIDYLILDSPLSDGYEIFDKVLDDVEKKEGLPKSFMKFSGNLYTKFKLGFTFDDFNTINYLGEKTFNEKVLIINSKADTTTPEKMANDIYRALKTDNKKIHTEDNYKHTMFALENPNGYKSVVEEFLKE